MRKMNKTDKTLLREYVKSMLREEDGGMGGGGSESAGSFLGGMGAAAGGYGMSRMTSNSALYNAFVEPLVAPFQVFKAELKKLFSIARRLAHVSFEAVITGVVPWLTDSYDEIEKADVSRRSKIESEYKDVYKRVYESFTGTDASAFGFMCFPGAFLTAKFAQRSPAIFRDVIHTVGGGGSFTKSVSYTQESLRRKKKLLGEAEGDEIDKGDIEKSRKEFLNNPKIKAMQASAQKVLQAHFNDCYEQAKSSLEAKTLSKVASKTAKTMISGSEKMKKIAGTATPDSEEGVDYEKELENAIDSLPQKSHDAIAATVKKFYIDKLEKELKEMINVKGEAEGVIDVEPIKEAFHSAIKRIKSI